MSQMLLTPTDGRRAEIVRLLDAAATEVAALLTELEPRPGRVVAFTSRVTFAMVPDLIHRAGAKHRTSLRATTVTPTANGGG